MNTLQVQIHKQKSCEIDRGAQSPGQIFRIESESARPTNNTEYQNMESVAERRNSDESLHSSLNDNTKNTEQLSAAKKKNTDQV